MSVFVSVAVLAEVEPDEAYRRLVDFERYPELTSSVRSVQIERHAETGVLNSSWAVDFRGGILRWTERDSIDPVNRVLGFEQIVGDLDSFAGRWQISTADAGCQVFFEAELDMGIPSLAAIIDPIAAAALRDNVLMILSGLLGQLTSPAGDPVGPSIGRHRADLVMTHAGQG